MAPLLLLAGLAFGLFALVAALCWFVGWLLFLPFRLLFWAAALPFILLKIVLVSIAAVLFGAVMAIGIAAVGFAILIAVIAPLLPLAIFVGLIWAVARLAHRPAAA
jgi:hypothetical protein